MKRILILGCGAMGSMLGEAVEGGEVRDCRIVGLFDSISERAEKLSEKLDSRPSVAGSFDEFISSRADLVIEAASQEAIRAHAENILDNKDLMVMSVGALLDESLYAALTKKAGSRGRIILIPSGAISGLDALRAVAKGLVEVTLITRKHPESLRGAPYFSMRNQDLTTITQSTVLYEGTAKEAVSLFPDNVNVAAVLSIVGLGAEKTSVKVIADPSLTVNTHEINFKSLVGEVQVIMRNLPHPDNPRTSHIAALSAIETLRGYVGRTVTIGT